MFGCGRLISQILNLPAISSCTSFAETKETFDKMLEKQTKNIPDEIIKPINDEFKKLTLNIKKKYGVEINSYYEVFCNPALLTIVYTTRTLQPDGEVFNHTYKFIGPSISSRIQQDSFDLSTIKSKNPLYISLGTVFNRSIDFYKLCFEAFGNSEHSVVMSIGKHTNLDDLGIIPPNFIVKQYVPQIEVLKDSKLFITHGGMNSTSEGLYNKVPLIVIPQNADQPIIAEQIAKIGAGLQLQIQNLTPIQLREAAEEVINNNSSYNNAIDRIKKSFLEAGGYHKAVNEIFHFLNR